MSGIVGICERDGAPVDRSLLRALTEFLAYRGPDAKEVWSQGGVGFGHTMLRTTDEADNERQPASLNARFWITADARIDCRDELMEKLEAAGCRVRRNITDPELILNAYAAWDEGCVERLRGDFSFAIWDHREQQLFCARDQFGIKPFYYAEIGETFVFSNTLNCARLHPGVPDDLNDDAILDFLIIGLNCDNSETTFEAVRRLPPAHCMKVSAAGIRVWRYWSLPADGRIRYKRAEDYVEHFRSVFRQAVADRLRTNRVQISLSGGLDSPTIAATARQLVSAGSTAVELRAYTIVYEWLIPDKEGPLAQEVADFLHIPIRFLPSDDLKPFSIDPEFVYPEPYANPYFGATFEEFQLLASECRVVLSGEGGDDIMDFQMWPYVKDLLRQREWLQLFSDVPAFLRVRRFPWRGLVRRIQRMFGKGLLAPVFPDWLSSTWARTVDVENRWDERTSSARAPVHPVLPRAHAALGQPQWTSTFESSDPGVTRATVEVRYPFLDLRVAEYLLALPPFPWLFKKNILRQAMAGFLPEKTLLRAKTPLAGDPLVAHLKRGELLSGNGVDWDDQILRFIDTSKWVTPTGNIFYERARVDARPLCLNFWLCAMRPLRYMLYKEARHG